MKIKIKQYHGKFRLTFFENYYIFRKRLSRFWDQFLEKGHEKMTIMFIPHNEKKIFNFQISKFTISFFILLFLVVVVTSSYAVISNTAIKREEQRLLLTYEDLRSHLLKFEKSTYSISEKVAEIKPEIEELYELAAGVDELQDDIWEADAAFRQEQKLLKKNRDIPDEIFSIRDSQKDINCTINTIKTVKNFIDTRNKVIQETPSLVPNQGHITSLFGWRRSPFGHGREFHTGIDVAASSGTEIRATAPGAIVSAGWSAGLGFMVKIQHKYGFSTIYGHCRNVNTSVGQTIKKGDIIAYVGQTGNATGPHCHYEIRLGDLAINPYPYMMRLW